MEFAGGKPKSFNIRYTDKVYNLLVVVSWRTLKNETTSGSRRRPNIRQNHFERRKVDKMPMRGNM